MNDNEQLATIKKPGEIERISNEEFERRILTIAKCKRDICWWAENFFRIVSLNVGLTTIKLYQKQKELLQTLVKNDRNIVLASRQVGKCVFKDTIITIRNKKTGITQNITIEDFFKLAAKQQNTIYLCNKKFIQSFNADGYEILTDTDWKNIKTVHKTIPYQIWKLTTDTHSLKCADDHIVFNENMNEMLVKELNIGQTIQTYSGLEKIINIEKENANDNMYDVELDDNSDHRYYTNGILSHNTTCYTVFCMWLATLFNEKKIMICANKLQTAIEIMDRMRIAYEYLPHWIKPGILVYNKSEITFSNMSSIRAFATSSSASRGFSGSILVIDEMAFIPKNIMDEFFASVMPVVSSAKNSKVIAVSTPNGTSGLYYDLWQQANSKESGTNKEGWKPFRIDWWEVPGRTEAWKEQQIATIGMKRWRQEFCNEFIAASTVQKLIPDDVLERYRMKLDEYKKQGIKPKMQKIVSQAEDELFEFEMWHEFKPNRTYLASADIAEGIGGDSSVLYIWDVTDLRNVVMCARFSSNVTSLVQFAYVANKMLALYGNPWLAAERNGVSAGMLDSLRITYGYQNIAVENKKKEAGIYSHVQVKSRACLWAKEILTSECFGFTIYDKDLIDEFGYFIKKDTKGIQNVYHAMPGPNSHDDHVMAFIWMAYILHNDRVQEYFIAADYSTSSLGQIYAKILQPLNSYTNEQLDAISKDPLYKEFLDFQKEAYDNAKNLAMTMHQEDQNDIFQYAKDNNTYDPYFDDYDDASWNNTPLDWNMKQGSQQRPLPNSIQLNNNGSFKPSPFFIV